jgi:hypothetical protein
MLVAVWRVSVGVSVVDRLLNIAKLFDAKAHAPFR